MLSFKKFLPIITTTSALVSTCALNLTSCAKVYSDFIEEPFDPKKLGEIQFKNEDFSTPADATAYYFSLIDDNKISNDIKWSATNVASTKIKDREIEGEIGDFSYTKFLIYLSDVKFDGQGKDSTTNETLYYISYNIKGKVSSLLNNIGLNKQSYRNDWYNFNLSISHVPYCFKHITFEFSEGKKEEKIYMCPYRLTLNEDKTYWDIFEGQEKIKYSCRHACEGFVKSGLQNYAYEAQEEAVIDKDHDYEPKFDLAFISLFIYSSWYMEWYNA